MIFEELQMPLKTSLADCRLKGAEKFMVQRENTYEDNSEYKSLLLVPILYAPIQETFLN